jgi:hypothetical protein
MRHFRLLVFTLSAASLGSGLFAQSTRTWVSGVGDDTNPCSRTAPCKTWAGAISRTAANGEIDVLDPGSFGAVSITKSITLSTDGFTGATTAPGTNGMTISNTTGQPMHVILKGLAINGITSGLSGVRVLGSSPVNLHIVDSRISGFTNGVNVSSTSTVSITIVNSRITNCVSGGSGINADATGAIAVSVALTDSEIHNCGNGLNLNGGTRAEVKNSDLSQNTTGVNVAGATSVATLEASTVAFCTTAVNVTTSGAIVRLTNDTITDSTTGLATVAGGNIISYSNNRMKTNTTNGAPTATLVQN